MAVKMGTMVMKMGMIAKKGSVGAGLQGWVKEGGLPSVTDMVVVSRSACDFSADARVAPCAIDLATSSCRGASLVCCAPRTGRTHQIRLHLQHVGHPIVGDDLYGVQTEWAPRQLLHAATLQLAHPRTGLPLKVAAPLPENFRKALQILELDCPADLLHLPEFSEGSVERHKP
eukprot:jgi/Botrbrau1/10794/Bobra.0119s0019.1